MTRVPVICCYDQIDDAAFDAAFAACPDPNGSGRQFVRLCPVRPSSSQAAASIDMAYESGDPPAVVLIDDWLQGDGYAREARPQGCELMRTITERYGNDRPICVLMTSRLDPTLAFAFVDAGGHNAIDTVEYGGPLAEQLPVVWSTLDEGERWTPTSLGEPVAFTADELALLPELQAGRAIPQILSEGRWTPHGLAELRYGIYARLRDAGLIDVPYHEHMTTELAKGALDGGAVWIPRYLQR